MTARITPRLADMASAATWRDVLAGLNALLVVLASSGGLMFEGVAVQLGLLAGVAAGLVATTIGRAAVVSAVACGLGVLLGPANAWYEASISAESPQGALRAAIVAAVVAAVCRYVLDRRPRTSRWVFWLAVAVIVANLWVTTLSANQLSLIDPTSGAQMPPFAEQLEGRIPRQIAGSDDAWFLWVSERVRDGEGFYDSFQTALVENPRWEPAYVMDYRMPTVFYAWALLRDASAVVPLFLVLASVGVCCAVPIASVAVKTPLALPACAALASYFVYFPVQLPLFSPEAWAVVFGLLSMAALAMSVRPNGRWRIWAVIAVCVAVVGTLIRETLVFLILGGLLSALFANGEQRRFRIVTWATGALVFAAAYAAHFSRVRPLIDPTAGQGLVARMGSGGFSFALAAVTYATDMLGGEGALPYVLAALGIIGAALLPDVRMRVFALVAGLVPLLSFLVLGNNAWYETSGLAINYWGATVIPLLYALVPVAFILIPGAAVDAPRRLR